MNRPISVSITNLHVWAGLSFGLLFCMMGLSGSVLIYRAEIEGALRPQWHSVSAARPASPLAEAERNIRLRWPDARVQAHHARIKTW